MNELALFAGAGGGILGGALLGWRTICAVECDAYAASVLVQRQNDGSLPAFPVWDDVRTFDGKPWRGIVDVVSGGFPCQDISCAGRGAGIEGERSGLWREFARIIGEVGPRYVFVENSPMLTIRGGVRVIGDLTELGYDCRWGIVGADDVGAPHRRKRIWIVADSQEFRRREGREGRSDSSGAREREQSFQDLANSGGGRCSGAQERQGEQSWGTEAERSGENVSDTSGPGRREELRGAHGDEGDYAGRSAEDMHFAGGNGAQRDVADAERIRCDTGLRRQEGQQSGGRREAWRESEAHGEAVVDANGAGRREFGACDEGEGEQGGGQRDSGATAGAGWWQSEPGVGRVANGVAFRVERLRALGNGQVPGVAALAWRMLSGQ
jgi:DNA (cytosine-5)-methyltransferase 1